MIKTIWPAIGVATALCILPPSAQASLAVVDVVGGVNDNAAASGRLEDAGPVTTANWVLNTTVAGNDFNNGDVQGGSQGVQYRMSNPVRGSTAVNQINFVVTPASGYDVTGFTISQSPYDNNPGSWNGGEGPPFLVAQFLVSWSGGGSATVTDPLAQLSVAGNIGSGTSVVFTSGQIFNSLDAWSIALPSGVTGVTVDWSAVNQPPTRALVGEWVTFNPAVTKRQPPIDVPVPGTLLLLSAGLLGMRRFIQRG